MAQIVKRLSEGEPLYKICRDPQMPTRGTVDDWCEAFPEYAAQFVRAREEGEEAIAAYCLDIADDSRNDLIAQLAEEGDEKAALCKGNPEVIQRSKVRIETRKWLLAVWNPKKWAQRTVIGGDKESPLEVVHEVRCTLIGPRTPQLEHKPT